MKTLRLQKEINFNIEDLLARSPIDIDNQNISEELRGKRVLVTGAAGSIGSAIVQKVLTFNPAMLILCDQAETALYYLKLEIEEQFPGVNSKMFLGDIRNYQRMHKLFAEYRPEIIFYLWLLFLVC